MNKKIKYVLCGSLMACALVTAQDKKTIKANERFENYSYSTAIKSFQELIMKGHSDEEIYKNLGDSNYHNANYIEASNWYGKLFTTENSAEVDPGYMYRYAQSLKSTEKYDTADLWMQKYQEANGADIRSAKIVDNPDYLAEINKNSGRYELKNLSINSTQADFSPSFKGDQLVFATERDSGMVVKRVHDWTNKPFTNLYTASPAEDDDFKNPTKLASLNEKTHETSAVFTKDGSTVYFTRNNSNNGNFSRDEVGVSRLKIYRATLSNDEWKNIKELPFNSDDYSCAHPALSADEKSLYFSSDMPGTVGASDIFTVEINDDGSLGAPKNLGNVINTEARETFPFVTNAGILYFASDGHPGLGGLDVFSTDMKDLDNLYIVNVGKPVNTHQDDFSFIINEETKKGFFTSNRDGGIGGDDIYGFTENEPLDLSCNTMIDGIVKDEETGAPLANSKVSIFNQANELVSETLSGTDGSFSLEGDCSEGDYKLVVSKDEYNDGDKMFAVISANDTSGVEIALDKKIKQAVAGTNLSKFLSIEPIYFDLDKADIRSDAKLTMQKVIDYMNAFPEAKIEIQSHTDEKASKRYNRRLSERRAKNTIAYLTSKNIDASRVSTKSFGESQLANNCAIWSKCTAAENEKNRRSEFIVLE